MTQKKKGAWKCSDKNFYFYFQFFIFYFFILTVFELFLTIKDAFLFVGGKFKIIKRRRIRFLTNLTIVKKVGYSKKTEKTSHKGHKRTVSRPRPKQVRSHFLSSTRACFAYTNERWSSHNENDNIFHFVHLSTFEQKGFNL